MTTPVLILMATIALCSPAEDGLQEGSVPLMKGGGLFSGTHNAERQPAAVRETQMLKNASLRHLAFTENQGQWREDVFFRTDAGGSTMWFTEDGAYYQFARRKAESDEMSGDELLRPGLERFDHELGSVETMMIKASFIGASYAPCIVGEEELEYKCNYFIGKDPEKWRTDVPNYQAIVYQEVYAGIDLKYYGNGRQMEYDFIVSPGANPDQICVQYDGVKSLSVNDAGELVVETDWGIVTELKPIVYQMEDEKRIPVQGEYVLLTDNTFGFVLTEGYNCELALVIDPVLSYSTYLGGSAADYGFDIAVDGNGNAFVAGHTFSTDFPTSNPYQLDQPNADIFISKLNGAGNSLIYSTYLGGSGGDYGKSIAVDAGGCAYVTGDALSADFPVQNPFQATYHGGSDVFVAKLSAAGSDLMYSTYLGGGGQDVGYGIAVDGSGNASVSGFTVSSDFPTQNPYQATKPGGYDAFVTTFNAAGNGLVYSTYLGGSGQDFSYCIAVDNSGNVYVSGETSSGNFPTRNPYQATLQGGPDVFVTKIDPPSGGLVYSTYLGGNSNEGGFGITADDHSNAYVTGPTRSGNYPTQDPYQSTLRGSYDAFVTKLNVTGNGLVYSTYLGGTGRDDGYDIAVDASGDFYITGYTDGTDFPTLNPYQADQPERDAIVTKFNVDGSELIYSSYFGGSGAERGYGIALDSYGNAYVAGQTNSIDFPTQNPYQTDQGGWDSFVAKFSTLVTVAFDIKPGSCPNPFNVSGGRMDDVNSRWGSGMAAGGGGDPAAIAGERGKKAVLPVAILGTVDFDVAQIDAAGVMLAGVPAVRWNYVDVATPMADDADECDCNDYGPDGFVDMTVKFDRAAIIAALGDVNDSDIIPLTISGQLVDGTPFEGVDCVIIRAGGNEDPADNVQPEDNDPAIADVSNYPNPFNPRTTISFSLPVASQVTLDVYNVMGQKVATVADGFYEAGVHACTWDGRNVASGVYFYRIKTPEYVETRKMMLLK